MHKFLGLNRAPLGITQRTISAGGSRRSESMTATTITTTTTPRENKNKKFYYYYYYYYFHFSNILFTHFEGFKIFKKDKKANEPVTKVVIKKVSDKNKPRKKINKNSFRFTKKNQGRNKKANGMRSENLLKSVDNLNGSNMWRSLLRYKVRRNLTTKEVTTRAGALNMKGLISELLITEV